MRRGRGSQLEQVLRVLTVLESARNGLTLSEIAAEVELSERTVRRYIEDVSSRYFPIQSRRDGDGRVRWRFSDGFASLPKLTLGLDEALALARLRFVVGSLVASPWRGPIENLLDRIERVVPRQLRDRIDGLIERFGVPKAAATATVSPPIYQALERAVSEERTIIVRYRSADGRKSERLFDPWLIYVAEGTVYAYGFDHRHGEGRSLALDRVLAASPTEQKFARPADFSPATFLHSVHRGFETKRKVRVVLRARGRAATLLVDRPEVADQTVEGLGPTEVRLRFDAPDTPALRARLLSFGPDVVVEEPVALRLALGAELKSAAARYAEAPAVMTESPRKGTRRAGLEEKQPAAHPSVTIADTRRR